MFSNAGVFIYSITNLILKIHKTCYKSKFFINRNRFLILQIIVLIIFSLTKKIK